MVLHFFVVKLIWTPLSSFNSIRHLSVQAAILSQDVFSLFVDSSTVLPTARLAVSSAKVAHSTPVVCGRSQVNSRYNTGPSTLEVRICTNVFEVRVCLIMSDSKHSARDV